MPGRILGVAGHEHDGGTHVTLTNRTTGQLICDSAQHYDADHISGVDQCVARGIDQPVAVIKRGQVLDLVAYYDQDAHPHPLDEDVMGLVLMYILQEG